MAKETITVCGVTFSADQVKSVTLRISGREIYIGDPDEDKRIRGFCDAVGSDWIGDDDDQDSE